MRSLKLFNCVLADENSKLSNECINGIFIHKNAAWAKSHILNHYKSLFSENLNNSSFYKSFKIVEGMSRFDLLIDQIIHYASTYGTNYSGEVFIPAQELNIPASDKLELKVVLALSKQELINKCLDLLKSGIALSLENINDLLELLINELNYNITDKDTINNKEAVAILFDKYGITPNDPVSVLRLAVYKATNNPLLIVNDKTIALIKNSSYNPKSLFEEFGLTKLAQIFNRFKPIFLAFKTKCPNLINRLAKLSKSYHKPMVINPLNSITNPNYKINDDDLHWFLNATPFSLFKALNALHARIQGQKDFCFRIRNGKSFAKSIDKNHIDNNLQYNYEKLWTILHNRFENKFSGKKVFIPTGVSYGLPTSTKMFVGNVPSYTTFSKDNILIGVYWENSWGARDIDLSCIYLNGKIGWNSYFNNNDIVYSGDVTDATNGASEYLQVKKCLETPVLIYNNIFNGQESTKFKLIIGYDNNIHRGYIIDSKNVIFEEFITSTQKQTTLAVMNNNSLTLLGMASGDKHVACLDSVALSALYQDSINKISLNTLLLSLGAELVDNPNSCDFDLSLNKLAKDTLIKLFES